MRSTRFRQGGFSLVELAVVMAIVSLLLGGLMLTLSAQTDQRNFEETKRRLDQARDSLLSFAIVNGRLPCPARYTSSASNSQGLESFCTTLTNPCTGAETTVKQTHGYCYSYDGYIPAASIGLANVDGANFAPDAWGNRLRYAVTRKNDPTTCAVTPPSSATPLFTSSTNLKAYGIACQPNDLLVCRSATGITTSDCGTASNAIMTTSTVVAVMFSTGKNGSVTPAGSGIDEQANLNGDVIFVSHAPAPSSAANGEFDDQMTWITAGELYGRLVSAGVLP